MIGYQLSRIYNILESINFKPEEKTVKACADVLAKLYGLSHARNQSVDEDLCLRFIGYFDSHWDRSRKMGIQLPDGSTVPHVPRAKKWNSLVETLKTEKVNPDVWQGELPWD